MNSKQLGNQHWSRLDPLTRNSLRSQYRAMRRIVGLSRNMAGTLVQWSASTAYWAVKHEGASHA